MSLEKNIYGIPLFISKVHQEALLFWANKGIQNASLVHIDSHDDLGEPAPRKYFGKIDKKYVSKLWQGNFILPAVDKDIVKEIYWIYPFIDSKEKGNIKYVGSKEFNAQKSACDLSIEKNIFSLGWENLKVRLYSGIQGGLNLMPNQINLENNWILDIDLDAFANLPQDNLAKVLFRKEDNNCWEKRVDDTIEILSKIESRPTLIDICRSQGDPTYCPPDLVDDIQDYVIEKLENLYKSI